MKQMVKTDTEVMLPPWMQAMRQAAIESVTPDDIEAIMKKQVQLAKAGDRAAVKFVTDFVMGSGMLRGATIVQNNYGAEHDHPSTPTSVRPGSAEKLAVMQRRAAAREPLCAADDGPELDLA